MDQSIPADTRTNSIPNMNAHKRKPSENNPISQHSQSPPSDDTSTYINSPYTLTQL